jgi:hypothetical protein
MHHAATVSPYLSLAVPLTFAVGVLGTVVPGRRAVRHDVGAQLRSE